MLRRFAWLPPVRWISALVALLSGARVSPQAILIGRPGQILLGKGSKVGARCRFDAGRAGAIEIGQNVWVSTDVEIQTESTVIIGARTTVQRRCTINGTTRIGEDCIFAPDVFVSSGTHPFRFAPQLRIREQERLLALDRAALASLDRPIWIQDDCWLGAHVVVAPGVTIRKGSVIGANAVVTRDVEPYSVVGGIPARRIGSRFEWKPPGRIDPKRREDGPYVLAGRIMTDSSGTAYLCATAAAPVEVALAAGDGSGHISLEYDAPKRVSLTVGRVTATAEGRQGRIDIKADDAEIHEGVAYCRVQVCDPSDGSEIRIRTIEIV